MLLFAPQAPSPEPRAGLDPQQARALSALGLRIAVESGAGLLSDINDDDFIRAGAEIVPSGRAPAVLAEADIVARVRVTAPEEIGRLKSGALHISFLDPFKHRPAADALAGAGASAVSLEFIPRTTLAQKMDALSSQANLAGYVAVITAASRLSRILPMLMTPAGTLQPARFFIIGAGVAGLQAIATARRLGARVEAYDTRPAVEEQVRSLGARFVKIDIGETGQTQQGYAKELTEAQIRMQQEKMAKVCAQADVVITTARVFGRPPPTLVTRDMLAVMKRGAVVVDLAADSGGNVEGITPGEETVTTAGVHLVGTTALETKVSQHATQMFAANIGAFIEHFWDKKEKRLDLRMDDEILKGSLIAHGGRIVHERFA